MKKLVLCCAAIVAITCMTTQTAEAGVGTYTFGTTTVSSYGTPIGAYRYAPTPLYPRLYPAVYPVVYPQPIVRPVRSPYWCPVRGRLIRPLPYYYGPARPFWIP